MTGSLASNGRGPRARSSERGHRSWSRLRRVLKPVDAPVVITVIGAGRREGVARRVFREDALERLTVRCLDQEDPGRLLVRPVAQRLLGRLTAGIGLAFEKVHRDDARFRERRLRDGRS